MAAENYYRPYCTRIAQLTKLRLAAKRQRWRDFMSNVYLYNLTFDAMSSDSAHGRFASSRKWFQAVIPSNWSNLIVANTIVSTFADTSDSTAWIALNGSPSMSIAGNDSCFIQVVAGSGWNNSSVTPPTPSPSSLASFSLCVSFGQTANSTAATPSPFVMPNSGFNVPFSFFMTQGSIMSNGANFFFSCGIGSPVQNPLPNPGYSFNVNLGFYNNPQLTQPYQYGDDPQMIVTT
ncbi:MAG TPA: hypothetical protein VNW97_03765 [Candidatus Saccharimonadales bacterium]|nr:hypothetical protein [Candidatus Saccharimonadales bacterium]